jgi:phage-related protein
MADLRVVVELAGKDAGASSVIKGVTGALGGIQGAVATSSSALGGFLDIGSKLGLMSVGFTGLKAAASALTGGLISGNVEMETYQTQLGTLLGSADKARDSLAKLAAFGAATPFELPEIVRAEKVLLGFGLTGDKVFKLTGKNAEQFRTVVGDVAAGTGARFEDIALTFGKFSAGATGEAIARFQELGVATREQMAALGVQFSKSGELLSPLPVAMEAITRIAQQKFGGGMDKLSKTAAGQLSTLADNWTQIKNRFAEPIFEAFRKALGDVNNLISTEGFQATLSSLAETLGGVFQSGLQTAAQLFQQISTVAASALPTLIQIGERLSTFFGSLMNGATLAQTVNAAFGDLIPPELNPILDAIDATFKRIKETILGFVATVQSGGIAGVWVEIQKAMSDFAPTGERLGRVFDSIKAAISAMIPDPVEELITQLFNIGKEAAPTVNILQGLADVFNTVTEFIEEHVAAQAALIGVLTLVATRWAIASVIQAYASASAVATAAVNAMKGAQIALNIALTANPVGLVIAALAALAAGLIYAYNNSEEFRDIVDATWETVRGGLSVLWDVIKIVSGNLVDAFRTAIQMYEDFRNTVDTTLNAVRNTVDSIFNSVASTIDSIHNEIYQTISSVWNQIPMDIREDLGLIYNEIDRRFNEMLAIIGDILGEIGSTIDTVWNDIMGTIDGILTNISNVINSQFDTQQSKVGSVTAEIGRIVAEGWAAVTAAIGAELTKAAARVTAFTAEVIAFLGEMATSVGAQAAVVGAEIVRGIEKGISGLWGWLMGKAGDFARDILNSMKAALGIASPSQETKYIAEELINGLVEGFRENESRAFKTMIDITQALLDTAEQMYAGLKGLARSAANDIGQFNESMAKAMQANLDRATDEFMDGLAKLGAAAAGALKVVNQKLAADLKKTSEDAANQIADVIEQAQRRIDDLMAADLLTKQIDARRDAFSERQKQEQDAFRKEADLAEIAYRRDSDIRDASLEAEKELLTAATEAERIAIDEQRQEKIAEAHEDYMRDMSEYERRQVLRQQEADFRKAQELERAAFEEALHQEELTRTIANINEERDERIRGIEEALAAKQAAIVADAEEERLKILDNLKKRVEDLKEEYLTKIAQAMKDAGVNIAEFQDKVLRDFRRMADESVASIQRILDKAAEVGRVSIAPPQMPAAQPNTLPLSGVSGGGIDVGAAGINPFTGAGPVREGINYNYNLTVNGNPPVNTSQEVADTIRRMQLVTQ